MLFLSNNGGFYQIYHFNDPGDINNFGYGDNQIGVELAGHSKNSYTRYSVSVLSSNEGGVGFTTDVVPGAPPSGRSYDVNFAFSQAFNARGRLVKADWVWSESERLPYIGQRPTLLPNDGRYSSWWARQQALLPRRRCGRSELQEPGTPAVIHVRA